MSEPFPAVPVTAVTVEPLSAPAAASAAQAPSRPVAPDPAFAAALQKAPLARPTPADTADRSRDPAWKVAKEFEGMMLGQMFASMFKGLESDGMFGGGHSEDTWRSFLFDEFGKATAENGGLGIAEALYRDLKGKIARSADALIGQGNGNTDRR